MTTCPICGYKNCSHLKAMVKKSKDGKGGPNNPIAPTNPIAPANPLQGGASGMIPPAGGPPPQVPPMSPSMGISATPGSFSPQQQMQMAAQGMMPAGSTPTPPPGFPPHLSNKPHKSPRGSGAHKLKKASLKTLVTKKRKPVF